MARAVRRRLSAPGWVVAMPTAVVKHIPTPPGYPPLPFALESRARPPRDIHIAFPLHCTSDTSQHCHTFQSLSRRPRSIARRLRPGSRQPHGPSHNTQRAPGLRAPACIRRRRWQRRPHARSGDDALVDRRRRPELRVVSIVAFLALLSLLHHTHPVFLAQTTRNR